MIPETTIAEIRQRTDIVAVVSDYVRLKRQGQNHVGLCPFHQEKGASFSVHPSRGLYHCFGCKASGDVLSFLMRIEALSFVQAAQQLADRAGIVVPELAQAESATERSARLTRERLQAVMESATAFYCAGLNSHPLAAVAQEELRRRQIAPETIARFRLGFAPPGWNALCNHLYSAGHALADAATLGLVGRRKHSDGYYDRFRNRLQFPIANVHGQIVAFSGRILPAPSGAPSGDDQAPKYFNSPENPLYRKGDVLFGLHQARVAVRRLGWATVCEGNFDLLALSQAGVDNVVAPLGTALTAAQATLLARYGQRVTLLFDGDAAGDKAVEQAYPLLRAAELGARVAQLPAGEDPDSFVRSHGAQALCVLIDNAVGIVEFMIERSAANSAGAPAAERAAAIARLGPVLAAVKNPVEIDLYVQRVMRSFQIADVTAVRAQLRRGCKPRG